MKRPERFSEMGSFEQLRTKAEGYGVKLWIFDGVEAKQLARVEWIGLQAETLHCVIRSNTGQILAVG